jgi:hypothetical protein
MSQAPQLCECLSSATSHELGELARLLRRARPATFAADVDALIDGLVEAIDASLAAQLDVVLAHPSLSRLESMWRGLHEVLARMPRDRQVRVEVLNCFLEDLEADFDDAPEIVKSGLFKLVYSGEYGPFGDRPYAAVLCPEAFEPAGLRLLGSCAEVAELAALQFVAQAGEQLLATASATADAGSRWRAFRRREEARFVSLVAGRWLVRPPDRRDPRAERPWRFREGDRAPRHASGTLLVALRWVESFVSYRTPIHAFGELDGRVAGLSQRGGFSTDGAAPPELAEHLETLGFVPVLQRAPGLVAIAGDTTCLDLSASPGRYLDEPGRSLHTRLVATLLAQRAGEGSAVSIVARLRAVRHGRAPPRVLAPRARARPGALGRRPRLPHRDRRAARS